MVLIFGLGGEKSKRDTNGGSLQAKTLRSFVAQTARHSG
jgi:hypothetical protein